MKYLTHITFVTFTYFVTGFLAPVYAGSYNFSLDPPTDSKKRVAVGKNCTLAFYCNPAGYLGSIDSYYWSLPGTSEGFSTDQSPGFVTYTDSAEGQVNEAWLQINHIDENGMNCINSSVLVAKVIVPKLEISEISFYGTGNNRIKTANTFVETNGSSIDSPEWTMSSTKPICYTKESSPSITIKFNITPDLEDYTTGVEIKAQAQQGQNQLNYPSKHLTLTGASATQDNMTTSDTLASMVFTGTYATTWSVSFDNEQSWNSIGDTASSVPIYCVWGTPTTTATSKRLEFWCNKANGATSGDLIGYAIGAESTSSSHFDVNIKRTGNDVWALLDGNGGDCGTEGRLGVESSALLGLSGSSVTFIYPCHASWDHLEQDTGEGVHEENLAHAQLVYYAPSNQQNAWEGCYKVPYNGGFNYWLGGSGTVCSNAQSVLFAVAGPRTSPPTCTQKYYGFPGVIDYPAGDPPP